MDNEVVLILNEIKIALYILVLLVAVGVIANWIRAGISLKNILKNEIGDLFNNEASNYYDEGKLDELIAHCEEKIKKKPNHSYALWYRAKAYYQKEEYEKSKLYFQQLSKMEPSWDESHVNPFLEKIEAISDENR